jgi:hypothetical protein
MTPQVSSVVVEWEHQQAREPTGYPTSVHVGIQIEETTGIVTLKDVSLKADSGTMIDVGALQDETTTWERLEHVRWNQEVTHLERALNAHRLRHGLLASIDGNLMVPKQA